MFVLFQRFPPWSVDRLQAVALQRQTPKLQVTKTLFARSSGSAHLLQTTEAYTEVHTAPTFTPSASLRSHRSQRWPRVLFRVRLGLGIGFELGLAIGLG